MARSRTDEILQNWKAVAHSASRPAVAPRPRAIRSGFPVGMLAATAVVVVLVAVVVRGMGSGPSLPVGGATPTTAASSSLVASPSAVSSSSASPSPVAPSPAVSPSSTSSQAAQSPSAAETGAARDAVDTYTADLVRGDYAAAWAMLAPETRTQLGSLASYTSERKAFFKSVAGRYTVKAWPTDVGPITNWLPAPGGAAVDLRHAVLVEVTYPALAGNNAGYEVDIVTPGAAGLEIVPVR